MNVFVMMPFANEFRDVYEAIKLSLSKSNIDIVQEINCIRLDALKGSGKITDDLLAEISKSHICIADITGNNPNVLWEVGYAMALQKPLILLSQNIDAIPFDLKHLRTIRYTQGNFISTLKSEIKEYFLAILKKYEFEKTNFFPPPHTNDPSSIAITGSMNLYREPCVRRLKTILTSFLGKNILWYVGSYGTADECTVEYLCEKEERVVIIGYTQYDISPHVLNLIRNNKLHFIDAQREQIPQISGSPSMRDTYMSIKSDLSIFLWDGISQGTKELIAWYQTIKKDFIVGFC